MSDQNKQGVQADGMLTSRWLRCKLRFYGTEIIANVS